MKYIGGEIIAYSPHKNHFWWV